MSGLPRLGGRRARLASAAVGEGLDQQSLDQADGDAPQRRRNMRCLATLLEQVPLQALSWLHDRLLHVGTMPHLERREAHRFGRVPRPAYRHIIEDTWGALRSVP